MSSLATESYYGKSIATLKRQKIPFLLGGAYALRHYTGIYRDTKDMDIFIREEDCHSAMNALDGEGIETEVTDSIWLGKAFEPGGPGFIDIIFNSGNGLCPVDDRWFEEAQNGTVYGQNVKYVPPEEMICSKAFIMARDRYDGADIAHLILKLGDRLDWKRLLNRFGSHWRVLLSHLVLFPYIYPWAHGHVPDWLMRELFARAGRELGHEREDEQNEKLCQGWMLNRTCYTVDSSEWGFKEPGREPEVRRAS